LEYKFPILLMVHMDTVVPGIGKKHVVNGNIINIFYSDSYKHHGIRMH